MHEIEELQTPISHLFLTPRHVYKLRKSVRLRLVDFSSRNARNAECLREVRLNQRLAPDVYLGLAPVQKRNGEIRVGPLRQSLAAPNPSGRSCEHLSIMRRLQQGRDALSLLLRGQLRKKHIDAIAERIARFHETYRLRTPTLLTEDEWRLRMAAPVAANLRLLEQHAGRLVSRETVEQAATLAEEFFRKHGHWFEARGAAGRMVNGHGDLRLEHIWFETDESDPLIIHCLEFPHNLRQIDAADDVALLAMDLEHRGRRDLAERFLRKYACETDDFDLYRVVSYCVAYRASARAKIAGLSALGASLNLDERRKTAAEARGHLEIALRALSAPTRGALVLLCGLRDSGKSSVAEAIADELDAVVISSDRVRRRILGVRLPGKPPTPSGAESKVSEADRRIYEGLLGRAEAVIESGRVAVIDASFAQPALRKRAWHWARDRGVQPLLVETRCSSPILLERLAQRAGCEDSLSNDCFSLYRQAACRFAAPLEWPSEHSVVVGTDTAEWVGQVHRVAERVRRSLEHTRGENG